MPPESIEYNKDELNAPEWLNNEFFTTVLHDYTKHNDIKIMKTEIGPASAKGDHYASVMFRAKVDYKKGTSKDEQTISLIIKTMPEYEGHKLDLLGDSYIFETEIGMYTEVVPQIEKILKSAGDNTIIKANCLYHSLTPKKTIIFEDIVPLGYRVIRDRQITYDEVASSYIKLAKWHAVTQKMNEDDPNYFSQYRHNFMTLPNMKENEFITDGIKNFIILLEKTPDLSEYVPYFKPIENTIVDLASASFSEYFDNKKPNKFYVLCHGDFHCKNIMLKYCEKTEKLLDVKLLDFQLSYMGPFVNDLIYSLFMLLDTDMRLHQTTEFFQLYIDTYQSTAKKIGYKGRVPQLNDILESLKEHRHVVVFLLATFLAMWVAFREGEVDPDELMDSNDARRSLYDNKLFVSHLKDLMPMYKALGYFDNL